MKELLKCNFFYEKSFRESLLSAKAYSFEGSLSAGVVPHHLVAGELIASFFKTASEKTDGLDAILIVAPNHTGRVSDIVTTTAGWSSPFGPVSCEGDFASALVENGSVRAAKADRLIESDHSASALIPYAAHYFPGVPVGVCLLSSSASKDAVRAVADEAANLAAKKRVLLICSADFSHYLLPKEAAARDEETLDAVMQGDIDRIMRFGNDNVDSPPSLSAFLSYIAIQGGTPRMLDHSSSDRILALPAGNGAYIDGTTTYFIFAG